MQRDAKAYLWDIANAAGSIRAFTAGKSLDAYLQDELLRAAVERKFGIIGEALSQLLRNFPDYRDKITLVGEIVGFRNQIVHGYASVRDDIVWRSFRSTCRSFKRRLGNCLTKRQLRIDQVGLAGYRRLTSLAACFVSR